LKPLDEQVRRVNSQLAVVGFVIELLKRSFEQMSDFFSVVLVHNSPLRAEPVSTSVAVLYCIDYSDYR
jgi:hypothetical protein